MNTLLAAVDAPERAPCVVIGIEPLVPLRRFLKDDRSLGQITVTVLEPDEGEVLNGIRCPLCNWRPSRSSLWSCAWVEGPELCFDGCGMVWNTFLTRGRCPGCEHQWRFTSCLQCDQWSLHDDWYEERHTRG